MSSDNKDWIVYIRAPIMPNGVEIMRVASIDELPDVFDEIKDKLPEWRVTTQHINNALREIEKLSNSNKK